MFVRERERKREGKSQYYLKTLTAWDELSGLRVQISGSGCTHGDQFQYKTIHALCCKASLAGPASLVGCLDLLSSPRPPKTQSLEAEARKSMPDRADGPVPWAAPSPSSQSGLHVAVASVNFFTSIRGSSESAQELAISTLWPPSARHSWAGHLHPAYLRPMKWVVRFLWGRYVHERVNQSIGNAG